MKDRIDADLVCQALQNAIERRKNKSGSELMWHSAKGVQHTSSCFQALLKKYWSFVA